jgi:signal transduction histidine kinase
MSIKEALNNALKHSEATEISVEAKIEGATFSIWIGDNGKGFKESDANQLGNGMSGMRKRMTDLGGRFDVCSTTKGTRLRFEVPLNVNPVPESHD